MTRTIIKVLAASAAFVLYVTAGLHLIGLPGTDFSTNKMEPGVYKDGLPAMWILPAVHWIFIASLSVGLSWYKSKACAAVLLAFGVLLIVNAAIIFFHIGAFIGVLLLLLAGLLLLLSGNLLRRDARVKT